MLHFLLWARISVHATHCHTLQKISAKPKKFPGFCWELISSLSPRKANPCFERKRMAHTIWRRTCLFSTIRDCRALLVIMSILDAGFSIVVFSMSADYKASRWYECWESLLKALLSFTQHEKGLFTNKPLPFHLCLWTRRAHGPSFGLYLSQGYFSSQLTLNFWLHPKENVLGSIHGGGTWWKNIFQDLWDLPQNCKLHQLRLNR